MATHNSINLPEGSAGQVVINTGTGFTNTTPTYPSTSGTAGKILRSDGTNNVYTTSTFADTYAINTLLYNASANTVSGLATNNSSVLVTSVGGVPSLSTTLPAGLTIPGYAASGANADITSMTGLTGQLKAPTQITDANNNKMLVFTAQASATDYVELLNSNAAGAFVRSNGPEASVPLSLENKNSYIIVTDYTGTVSGIIRFYNAAGTKYTSLQVATAQATDLQLTLPAVDGSANFIMKTSGAGVLSFANGSQIPGTTTNDNASTGNIGEFVSSIIASASAITINNAAATDMTSISLTAGDWDVWGNISYILTGQISSALAWVSSTSNTLPDSSLFNGPVVGALSNNVGAIAPMRRFSLAGTTTIYISGFCGITSGTAKMCGAIYARRVR